MKLNLKIHTATPRIEKIKLDSELVDLFDHYLKFYQNKMGIEIKSEKAIIEMLTAFIKSDRNFMHYYRQYSATTNKIDEAI